jgi:hypothetical protein
MWIFEQATGDLVNPEGIVVGQGYSGRGAGVDNPADEQIPDVGPLPEGFYTISPFFDDPGGKGPIVAHLIPDVADQMFERSGFMIHGDNREANHSASEGCIILARTLRELIAASADRRLEVVA